MSAFGKISGYEKEALRPLCDMAKPPKNTRGLSNVIRLCLKKIAETHRGTAA